MRPESLDSVKLGPQVSEMSGRYRHDPEHPARLNKQGQSEPAVRQLSNMWSVVKVKEDSSSTCTGTSRSPSAVSRNSGAEQECDPWRSVFAATGETDGGLAAITPSRCMAA
jgi:hypothetical protein